MARVSGGSDRPAICATRPAGCPMIAGLSRPPGKAAASSVASSSSEQNQAPSRSSRPRKSRATGRSASTTDGAEQGVP